MDTIVEEIFSAKTLFLTMISYSVGTIPIGFVLDKYKIGKKSFSNKEFTANHLFIGFLVFCLGIAKGYITGSAAISLGSSLDVAGLCGLASVIGSCFPIWFKFSVGKGGATALGALALMSLPLAVYTFLGFCMGFSFFKRFSGGTIFGSLTGVIASFYLLESSISRLIVFLIFAVILSRNEENILRIFIGRKI